jgi:excisionase family DNA binding protein
MNDSSDMLTVRQAADQAGVSTRTIRRWIDAGLSASESPHGKLIDRETFTHFLEARYASVTPQTTVTDNADIGDDDPVRVVTPSDTGVVTELRARIADLETERVWLRERVERVDDTVRGLIVALSRAEQRAEIAEGRIDELLAIAAAPEPSQDARSAVSDAEAPAPDELPVTADQKRTGPFWRSWLSWWVRRHP